MRSHCSYRGSCDTGRPDVREVRAAQKPATTKHLWGVERRSASEDLDGASPVGDAIVFGCPIFRRERLENERADAASIQISAASGCFGELMWASAALALQ